MDIISLATCYLSLMSLSTCLAICITFKGFLSSLPFLKKNLFTYLDSALCVSTPVAVTAEVSVMCQAFFVMCHYQTQSLCKGLLYKHLCY